MVLVELHVPDLVAAQNFYRLLGFAVVMCEDNHMIMQHGTQRLSFHAGKRGITGHEHFQKHPEGTIKGYGVEIVIVVEDIQFAYQILDRYIVAPLQKRKWGACDFRAEDPFGYYLCITEWYPMLEQRTEALERT